MSNVPAKPNTVHRASVLRVLGLSLVTVAVLVPASASAGTVGPVLKEAQEDCHQRQADDLVSQTLWVASQQIMRNACGNLFGFVGYEAVTPCQPPNSAGRIGQALGIVQGLIKDEFPCRPTVSDQLNATAAAEENLDGGPLAALDAFCAASGAGDAREGLCGAAYGRFGAAPRLP